MNSKFWLTVIDKHQLDHDNVTETGVIIQDSSESLADLKEFVDQLNQWGVPAAIVMSEDFDDDVNDVVYCNESYNIVLGDIIEQLAGNELNKHVEDFSN